MTVDQYVCMPTVSLDEVDSSFEMLRNIESRSIVSRQNQMFVDIVIFRICQASNEQNGVTSSAGYSQHCSYLIFLE